MTEFFKILCRDRGSKARAGRICTPHGEIDTPVFMPVATQATVKGLSSEDLLSCGVQMLISNAYHLYLRPGRDIIEKAGGIHNFMNWKGAITTDSGGFQVFSLAQLAKVRKDGVEFQSHIDGRRHFFTPQDVVDFQLAIGSDILMPLDECVKYPASRDYVEQSVQVTLNWARISRDVFYDRLDFGRYAKGGKRPVLFGIVQGGTYPDLRKRCVDEMVAMGFDGYAIGGVAVGEPREVANEITAFTADILPEDRLRYLMGVGTPIDLLDAVDNGVDMFDCVVPTRNGRNGQAFTFKGEVQVKNAKYKEDFSPIDPDCKCPVCLNYSKAYIRHLFNTDELLVLRLVSLHNIYFYVKLIGKIQEAIKKNEFKSFYSAFKSNFRRL